MLSLKHISIYKSQRSHIVFYSFESDHHIHHTCHEYLTTNLVSGRNLTLADLITEEASHDYIHQRYEVAAT